LVVAERRASCSLAILAVSGDQQVRRLHDCLQRLVRGTDWWRRWRGRQRAWERGPLLARKRPQATP